MYCSYTYINWMWTVHFYIQISMKASGWHPHRTKGYGIRLLKRLYGLKQTPRNWNMHIRDFIQGMGFKQSILDSCLHMLQVNNETYLLLLCVDDIIIACSRLKNVEISKLKLTEAFDIKNLGEINRYRGMKIVRSQSGVKIDQTTYGMKFLRALRDI